MNLIEWLWGVFRQILLDPLSSDASFRAGFLEGLAMAAVAGWLGQQLYHVWNQLLQFFHPTQLPAHAPGPTPAAYALNFLSTLAWLALIAIAFAIVVYLAGQG